MSAETPAADPASSPAGGSSSAPGGAPGLSGPVCSFCSAAFRSSYFPYAHLQIGHLTVAMATTAGAGSLIIGVLLIVLGISLWFQKHVRIFAGVAAILLALVSLPVSNFGGFVVGFLLSLVGGAMGIAWSPGPRAGQAAGEARPVRRRPGAGPARRRSR